MHPKLKGQGYILKIDTPHIKVENIIMVLCTADKEDRITI